MTLQAGFYDMELILRQNKNAWVFVLNNTRDINSFTKNLQTADVMSDYW